MYRIFVTLSDARTNHNGPTKKYREALHGHLAVSTPAESRLGSHLGRQGLWIEAYNAGGTREALRELVAWARLQRGRISVHAEYLNKATLRVAQDMGLVFRGH